jgi:hypothetical protein
MPFGVALGQRCLVMILAVDGADADPFQCPPQATGQRSLQSIVAGTANLSSREVIRIMLETCGALQLDRSRGDRPRSEAADLEALGLLFDEMLTQASSPGSPGLRHIVDRALGRESQNRYATLRDLVRDLERENRANIFKTLLPIMLWGMTLLLIGRLLGYMAGM